MDDGNIHQHVVRVHGGPARLVSARVDPRVGGPCFTYVVTTPRGEQLVRAWVRRDGRTVLEAGRVLGSLPVRRAARKAECAPSSRVVVVAGRTGPANGGTEAGSMPIP